ncbi:hypothetical protein ACOME3_001729 [Neoechinorhynchus agilis]
MSADVVKTELEKLNGASRLINQLENDISKIRSSYKECVSRYCQQLDQIVHKIGKSVIQRARIYYDTVEAAQKARAAVNEASDEYIHSQSAWEAMANTAYLAQALCGHQDKCSQESNEFCTSRESCDCLTALQSKLKCLETNRMSIEHHHKQKSIEYQLTVQKAKYFERKFSRSIKRAKSYFELRQRFNTDLKMMQNDFNKVQLSLSTHKQVYRSALCKLEEISDKIRDDRLGKMIEQETIEASSEDIGMQTKHMEDHFFQLNDRRMRLLSHSCCLTFTKDNEPSDQVPLVERHNSV